MQLRITPLQASMCSGPFLKDCLQLRSTRFTFVLFLGGFPGQGGLRQLLTEHPLSTSDVDHWSV